MHGARTYDPLLMPVYPPLVRTHIQARDRDHDHAPRLGAANGFGTSANRGGEPRPTISTQPQARTSMSLLEVPQTNTQREQQQDGEETDKPMRLRGGCVPCPVSV